MVLPSKAITLTIQLEWLVVSGTCMRDLLRVLGFGVALVSRDMESHDEMFSPAM